MEETRKAGLNQSNLKRTGGYSSFVVVGEKRRELEERLNSRRLNKDGFSSSNGMLDACPDIAASIVTSFSYVEGVAIAGEGSRSIENSA